MRTVESALYTDIGTEYVPNLTPDTTVGHPNAVHGIASMWMQHTKVFHAIYSLWLRYGEPQYIMLTTRTF